VDVSGKGGLLLLTTLSVASGNLNFLEGCVRCFIDGGPQMLLSSGTEDYFDSAFYFNAGGYQLPNAGLTHLITGPPTQVTAYRFHILDPIVWKTSFKLVWRNGDTVEPSNGQKCINDNGTIAGSPTNSNVTSYPWVYHF